MSNRRTKLVDCNPRWAQESESLGGATRYLMFDCPEGHADCSHSIPFTPALDGGAQASPQQNGAQWTRSGDTFETLTLSPSIRRIQRYADKAAALAAGCLEEDLTDSLFCALHIFIVNGEIQFCGDSK